jgi:hypothetical protein
MLSLWCLMVPLQHYLNHSRYRPWNQWEKRMESASADWTRELLGTSEEGRPLWSFTLGNGPITRLAWAQMHGNEPTATCALLRIMNETKSLPNGESWAFFPVVNPDGAERFTRANAQGVDINRDAKERTSREAQVLWNWIQNHQPKVAYNLHDQRSWFGLPNSNLPATFSVLAARANPEGLTTPAVRSAQGAAGDLAHVFHDLSGLPTTTFDGTYYPGAFGENVQASGIPVVLVETGSHSSGYDRSQQVSWLAEALKQHWTLPTDRVEYYQLLEQAESGRFDLVLTSPDPLDQTDWAFVASERMEQGFSKLFWELTAVGSGLAQQAPFAFERGACPAVSIGDRWEDLSSLMQ